MDPIGTSLEELECRRSTALTKRHNRVYDTHQAAQIPEPQGLSPTQILLVYAQTSTVAPQLFRFNPATCFLHKTSPPWMVDDAGGTHFQRGFVSTYICDGQRYVQPVTTLTYM
jgi:hypothetical protein